VPNRLDRLAPRNESGQRIPRWVRCYDNQGESIDRYTVVYSNTKDGYSHGISMSAHPFHPQGVGMHFDYSKSELWCGGNRQYSVDRPKYAHLGKKIKFTDLPDECRRCVLQDYAEIWKLKLSDLTGGSSWDSSATQPKADA
jgi:hypothetical protein